jgi:iron only hydrogenase large subunit-like protein
MDFLNPIFTEKAECQDCYKCIRECSVKAIRVEGGRAAVVPELCVLCGHCVQVCPVGAKRVRDDLPRAKRLVGLGQPVVAALAPSFASEFPDLPPENLVAALRELGFARVSETSLGADIVSRRLAGDLREAAASGEGGLVLSSACPTVVEYLEKYRPAFAPSVTGLLSPLLAHAKYLKEALGSEAKVVFIGPCISKKREADLRKELVDVAIDFSDLASWLESAGVDPRACVPGPEDRFFPERAAKGSLYPIEGGMIASVRKYEVPARVRWMSFSGLSEIDRALSELEGAALRDPVFLELLACPGGCVNGPRSRSRSGTVAKRLSVQGYAESAEARGPEAAPEIAASWRAEPVRRPEPAREAVEAALRRTGKYSVEDELNCGGCGYDACRDFARAMIEGRAEAAMCVSYMRKLAQKKANGLLKSIPSGVVIADRELKVVECNKAFALLLGPEAEALWEAKPGLEGADLAKLAPFAKYFSEVMEGGEAIERDIRFGRRILHGAVFGIERGAFAGGVFQDITSPWIRKDRVVSQARQVIQKNLAVVQKIAFLLGENAAESEAILTSIIDSFEDDGGGPEEGAR